MFSVSYLDSILRLAAVLPALVWPTAASSIETVSRPTVITQFPNETWIENLAVRSNGKILATTLIPSAAVYQIDPQSPGAQPQLVANISAAVPSVNGALGIAEYGDDVFAIAVSNFSFATFAGQAGSNAVLKLNMTAFDLARPGSALSHLASLPGATTVNGLAPSMADGSVLLVADSAGAVHSVDTRCGAARTVLSAAAGSPQLGMPRAANLPLGANGLKVQAGGLFVSNTNAQTLLRFPLGGDGLPSSRVPRVVARFTTPVDDFDLAADGTAFIVTSVDNGLDSVSPSGRVRLIAGRPDSGDILGGTAARFGRTAADRSVLYVSTNGGIGAPLNGTFIEGGQVLAIQTDKEGAAVAAR